MFVTLNAKRDQKICGFQTWVKEILETHSPPQKSNFEFKNDTYLKLKIKKSVGGNCEDEKGRDDHSQCLKQIGRVIPDNPINELLKE